MSRKHQVAGKAQQGESANAARSAGIGNTPVHPTGEPELNHLTGRPSPDWGSAYRQHANNVRTWAIAFGVGAPAAVLSRDTTVKAFVALPHARAIVMVFLAGVLFQVIFELCDKHTAWWGYADVHNVGNEKWSKRKKGWADWWLKTDWPGVAADVLSFGCFFATAAYVLLKLL